MWRNLFFACVSILLGGVSPAETNSVSVVEIDSLPKRARVDLGQAAVGEPVSGSIELRNGLGKPVTIRSLDPDCGCLDVTKNVSSMDQGETVVLGVKLMPSQKVGVIRRTIRVLFEEARHTPLDLKLDTTITGPVELNANSVVVKSQGKPLKISGEKRESSIEILSCESVRGSCEVLSFQQDSDGFQVSLKPLFSFGSANELLRIRYKASADEPAGTVDLPLELRGSIAVRFLPSASPLAIKDDEWFATSRLVLTPGSGVKADDLQVSIVQANGEQLSSEDYTVTLSPVSVVLFGVQAKGKAPKQSDSLPAKLKVARSNGDPLATLEFLSH